MVCGFCPGPAGAVRRGEHVRWRGVVATVAGSLWLMSRMLAARGCRGVVAALRVRVGVWGRSGPHSESGQPC